MLCVRHIVNEKILIVEDDDGIMDILNIILKRAGYETNSFSDGRPVMAGKYELPDLYLLDKQLSGVDGLDICRHLKEDPLTKNIPVIMVSANPQINVLSENAGADDYIEKPFTIETLLSTIKQHLGQSSQTLTVISA